MGEAAPPAAPPPEPKLGAALADTNWKTVCNGIHFWRAFQKVPRKCTQSKVKISDDGTRFLKEYKSDSWYRKEKRMLQNGDLRFRCGSD